MKEVLKKVIISTSVLSICIFASIVEVNALELGEVESKQVKNYIDNNIENINVRFAGDIPYVRLNDLYSIISSDTITIDNLENGVYKVTTEGGSAIINTIKNTLFSNNYADFIRESEPESDSDFGPIMVKDMTYQQVGTSLPKTIDFTKYDIELYGEGNELWMPVATIIDMFMKMGFYDGNMINILDPNDADRFSSDNEYISKLQPIFNNKQRFSQYSKQAYNELCFLIDNYYGFPERNSLNELIKNNGLDHTLRNYNDETVLIRSWLLSDNLVEYYAGLASLDAVLYDGGHTNLIDIFKYGFLSSVYPEVGDSIPSLANESRLLYEDLEIYKNKPLSLFVTEMTIDKTRREAFGNEKYVEKGDTVVYSFDDFNFSFLGWNNYYENGGEYPNDTLGNILSALDKAKENPNIKYFVFDISNNTGGVAVIAPIIMNFIGYDNIMREKNTLTNQIDEIGFKIDINRDGIYDENDKVSKYNFKYGVLTSRVTFSTANLFTSMAKDNGFAILGEQSSGGACNIELANTSEGIIFSMSSVSCSVNKNGKTVDLGTMPDYDLTQIIDGKKNYTKLYNLDILSEALNDFYKEKQEVPINDSNKEEKVTPINNFNKEKEISSITNIKNPTTSDNIILYILMLGLSLIGLVANGLYKKLYITKKE